MLRSFTLACDSSCRGRTQYKGMNGAFLGSIFRPRASNIDTPTAYPTWRNAHGGSSLRETSLSSLEALSVGHDQRVALMCDRGDNTQQARSVNITFL
jgi:hypothetical protein